jgi:hypothetical protein
VESVVVLPSLGRDEKSPALRRFLHDSIVAALDGGPRIAEAPARVKSPPSSVTPAAISRLRWDKGIVPTVLTVVAKPGRNDTEFSFTLLDGKEVLWQGALKMDRREIAMLPVTPLLNQHILEFAASRIGQQVGNGECWTLADEALKAVGAGHASAYVWGRALAPSEEVYPGDVIQFTSVKLENGRGRQQFGTPNHTAIVKRPVSPGIYVILHQNWGKAGRTVSELEIDLSTKTAGEFVIYRPVSKKT